MAAMSRSMSSRLPAPTASPSSTGARSSATSATTLSAPGATQGYIASVGLPAPLLSYLGALAIELGGGLMLVLGYRTRLAALGLAAFSVISAFVFHHALGDQNQMFHFLKNIAMAGGLLQVVAFGPGAFSIDSRRQASPAVGFAV